MTEVVICVGSSCHLKGARRVVEGLAELVAERGLANSVKLSGSFCIGRCAKAGVSVQIDGDIHFVDPDRIEEFFNEMTAGDPK